MTVEDAIAAMRAALASGAADAQYEAALALGRLQHVDAAPTLIATMRHASSPTAREIAALELGHLELPAVIDALLAVLADTSQPAHVRRRRGRGPQRPARSAGRPCADCRARRPRARDPL